MSEPHPDLNFFSALLKAATEFFKTAVEWLKFQKTIHEKVEHNEEPQNEKLDLPPTTDWGYFLHYRIITSRYTSRKKGVIIHTIEIEATRDRVTHYDGRYRLRNFQRTILKPSNLKMHLTEKGSQFQKFIVPFDKPLEKGQKFILTFEHHWHEEEIEHLPEEYVTISCETKILHFRICIPTEEIISHPTGYERASANIQESVFTADLNSDANIISWQVEPRLNFHYRVSWTW